MDSWFLGIGGRVGAGVGALIGFYLRVNQRVIAAIMAFGGGVLISALSFDLMDEAYKRGGFDSTAIGFVGGATVYTVTNWLLNRAGAKHRKRSGHHVGQPSEQDQSGSGLAIAVGALLDGIPESIVIGLSMLKGGSVSLVAVTAIFLSNVPEGLSSSAGMNERAGRRSMFSASGAASPFSRAWRHWPVMACSAISPRR